MTNKTLREALLDERDQAVQRRDKYYEEKDLTNYIIKCGEIQGLNIALVTLAHIEREEQTNG